MKLCLCRHKNVCVCVCFVSMLQPRRLRKPTVPPMHEETSYSLRSTTVYVSECTRFSLFHSLNYANCLHIHRVCFFCCSGYSIPTVCCFNTHQRFVTHHFFFLFRVEKKKISKFCNRKMIWRIVDDHEGSWHLRQSIGIGIQIPDHSNGKLQTINI